MSTALKFSPSDPHQVFQQIEKLNPNLFSGNSAIPGKIFFEESDKVFILLGSLSASWACWFLDLCTFESASFRIPWQKAPFQPEILAKCFVLFLVTEKASQMQ